MEEKDIADGPRLPIVYDTTDIDKIINPFHERFRKFEDVGHEFVDICLNNLTFAVYNIMKWKEKPLQLAPFQSVALQNMWDKTFPIILMSRGASKSFLLAIYSLLRAIFVPGSKIVIVAASFRQSKIVFDYIEQIYNYSPIIQSATIRMNKPNDAREMYIGSSVIRALPLGNGEKIRGVRACVAEDTLIETNYGLINIKDVVEDSKDYLIYDGVSFNKPSHYCRTDITNVHRIETVYGFRIEFSDIHRIDTDGGWKDIKSITTDDRVVMQSSSEFAEREFRPTIHEKYNELCNDYYMPEFVNEDVSKILGYLVSEGCISNENDTILFNSTDRNIIDDYCSAFKKAFGVSPQVYTKDSCIDYRGLNCRQSYEAKICRIGIRKYLFSAGLDYVTAPDKKVPKSILQSPRNVVISFLQSIFEGSGTAVLYKDARRNSNEFYIAYYSASRELCSQLQILLMKFGLIGCLSRRDTGNANYYLRLTKSYATAFAKDIGFISKRKIEICNEAMGLFTPKYYNGRSIKIKRIDKNIRKDVLYDVCIPDSHAFIGNCIKNHNSDIICDEYASIPEEIFQVVVRGFAAVSSDPIEHARRIKMEDDLISAGKMDKKDRHRFSGNKIIYAGTASYQFNHFYRLYCIHKMIIDSKFIGDAGEINEMFYLGRDAEDVHLDGNLDYRDYSIIQVPYTALPKGFMDEKQIVQAKATMPRALFSMEYECKFPSDSDGFFKRALINNTTPGLDGNGVGFSIELAGDQNYEYVMGVDPARQSDNFAISILKIVPGKGYKNVYCYSMHKKNWIMATRKIRELLLKFKIVRMAIDQGGGGTTVEDLIQNSELLKKGEPPIWRYDDSEQLKFEGLHILDMVNFTPSWIREANYGLASDIEHGRLLFPYRVTNAELDIVDEVIADNDVDVIEPWDEIDEQINEICSIIVTHTKTGIEHFDLPEIPSAQRTTVGASRRKDRYSALLLSTYAARTYISEGQVSIEVFSGNWADLL